MRVPALALLSPLLNTRMPALALVRALLAESPARPEDGAAQLMVARRGVAQLGEQEVDPGCELDRGRHLERFVAESRAKAAPVDVDRQLGDRAAVQVPALGLRDRDPFDQVVEKIVRLVTLDERRVAEDARVVNRQSWGGADCAIHLCGGFGAIYEIQSV